jgi:ketosteroid isomerase-like protein
MFDEDPETSFSSSEATMSNDKNIETIKAMYAAFGRGDLPFVLEQLADEGFQDWRVNSATDTGVPWHQNFASKRDVPGFFQALSGNVEHVRFEPRDFASNGNQVYATIDMTLKVKATGKMIEMNDVVHVFTFKNGRIVKLRAAEDTALGATAF